MSTLKAQAVKSIKWTSLQTIIVGLTGPVVLILKSQFLEPADFAYLSIILIVIGLFKLLENFGISQAIIQKDAITVKESSSIFWFNILFSALLAVIIYRASSLIAEFYAMPGLEHYLKVASVIVLINGPSVLFRAYLEKAIFFKQLAVISISRNMINLAAIFLLLFQGYGVLGVVYAHIISTLAATLMIITISLRHTRIRLGFHFKASDLYPFLRFGAFVSGKQLLTFATHRVDELLIGYLLSPEILGIYHFGKQMLEKIRGIMTRSFSKVLFPVFSKLKNNTKRLSGAYRQISKFLAHGAFPVFTGIAVTAHLFVPVVFGEKWEDSIIVFQIFSLSMIFLLLTANVSSALLYSVNKPGLVFYIDLITNSIYLFSLLLFASRGLIAILLVYTAYIIYKTMILQYFTNKQLTQTFTSYLQGILLPAVLSSVMIISILLFQHLTSAYLSDTVLLVCSILLGGTVFTALSWFFARDIMHELIRIIKGNTIKFQAKH
ncbi:MAG: lipopolysaccharide biosynthesis protein [Bacteroidales bacterium]